MRRRWNGLIKQLRILRVRYTRVGCSHAFCFRISLPQSTHDRRKHLLQQTRRSHLKFTKKNKMKYSFIRLVQNFTMASQLCFEASAMCFRHARNAVTWSMDSYVSGDLLVICCTEKIHWIRCWKAEKKNEYKSAHCMRSSAPYNFFSVHLVCNIQLKPTHRTGKSWKVNSGEIFHNRALDLHVFSFIYMFIARINNEPIKDSIIRRFAFHVRTYISCYYYYCIIVSVLKMKIKFNWL